MRSSFHVGLICNRTTYILLHSSRIVNRVLGGGRRFSYNRQMKKDAPLAFRIPADLKKKLQRVSKHEARSLSQICELLLRIGAEEYEREGHRYLQKVLTHPRDENEI